MNYSGSRLSLTQRRRVPIRGLQGGNADYRKHRPDYLLLIFMSILLVIGAVVVYAIGPGITNGTGLSENYYSYKQLSSIGLGVLGFLFASVTATKRWKRLQVPVVIAAIIVAILVRLIGDEIYGAHRWIQVAGFSFQAAELIKLAIVLYLANYLSSRDAREIKNEKVVLRTLGIILAIVAVVVAGLQSDLGSAAVMMAVIVSMAFVVGVPLKRLASIGLVVISISLIAVISTPYRRDRVATFLNPTADCQVEGYQACQALITIGSGGLFGKGLGRSVQAYGYLPKPENDSIFAIVSEKFGFVGSMGLIAVFWMLFRRIAIIAKTAPDNYSRLLVNGILVWLSSQTIINVGAMVGLLPLKGITLPFISYGGTSIIFVMTAIGIVFNVSRYTDLTIKQGKDMLKRTTQEPTRFSRRYS